MEILASTVLGIMVVAVVWLICERGYLRSKVKNLESHIVTLKLINKEAVSQLRASLKR